MSWIRWTDSQCMFLKYLKSDAFMCLTESQFILSSHWSKIFWPNGVNTSELAHCETTSLGLSTYYCTRKQILMVTKLRNEGKLKIIKFTVRVSRMAQPRRVNFSSRWTYPTPHLGDYRHIQGLNSHFGEWRSTECNIASATSKTDGWPDESCPRLIKPRLPVTVAYAHNISWSQFRCCSPRFNPTWRIIMLPIKLFRQNLQNGFMEVPGSLRCTPVPRIAIQVTKINQYSTCQHMNYFLLHPHTSRKGEVDFLLAARTIPVLFSNVLSRNIVV